MLLGKDRPWAESGGQSVHPVVITRGHRKLNRARPAVRKAMAVRPHVVPKRRGVNDAVAHQRHAQLFGEFAVRRSIAGWLDTKPTLQCLEAPLQLLLDPGVARIRQQMVIPMMADLMAGLENRLSHRGMRIRRPAGDEEGRLQFKLIEQLQEFRRADTRLVAAITHRDEALGVQRVLAGPGTLRVHVK